MSFASTLDVLRPTLPCYLALARHRLLRLSRDNFELHPNPAAPPLAATMAQAVFAMGASTCVESYVMSRTLAEGPKVFAFNALTCEALENFELSLGTADYLQPFPSVVIDLPSDYTRKRVVPFDAGIHAPEFMIVRHEPDAGCVLVTMHMTSQQVLTRLLKLDPAWTLEEMWAKGARAWESKDSLGLTAEETALGSALTKLGLNVALLATTYGVRCLGPANPSHYERLQRYAKVARKKGPERQERAEADLQTAPVRYGFAQEVVLYRRESAEVGAEVNGNGSGGWTVAPHWRRGHWRAQACGPGSTGWLPPFPATEKAAAIRYMHSPEMTVAFLSKVSGQRENIEQARAGEAGAVGIFEGDRVRAAGLSLEQRRTVEFEGLFFGNGPYRPDLEAALRELGLTARDFRARVHSGQDAVRFLADIPNLDILLTLRLARDQDQMRPIDRNDIRDLDWLSVALPYSNLVVSENYWGHQVRATKLDGRYGTVLLTDLRQLPEQLRVLGCIV